MNLSSPCHYLYLLIFISSQNQKNIQQEQYPNNRHPNTMQKKAIQRRRTQSPSGTKTMNTRSLSPVFLPEELIAVLLSFLTVKHLIKMKCVSKSWNSLISDPRFIKMHLDRSARKPYLALLAMDHKRVITIPISRLLHNSPFTIAADPSYSWDIMYVGSFVGSCNGLLCVNYHAYMKSGMSCLHFYNPATRILSKEFWYSNENRKNMYPMERYTFGYDSSSDTYKVVMYGLFFDSKTKLNGTRVRVFSLGDNVWRDIEDITVAVINHDVYFSGSVNWLALENCFNQPWNYDSKCFTLSQFVIVSLDFGTETYTRVLLPQGFDEVPHLEPAICVLMNNLCFCHDFKKTDFVIWQMKELGVEESWIKLLTISYQNLQLISWLPLHLSEDNNTLIMANNQDEHATIYNLRDGRVDRIITSRAGWAHSKNHVESLVSIC